MQISVRFLKTLLQGWLPLHGMKSTYTGVLVTILLGGTAASWLTSGKGPWECYGVSLESRLVHPKSSSSWYKLVFVLLVLLSS